MIEQQNDSTVPANPQQQGEHELRGFCNQWWCFLLLGISLAVLGLVAMSAPFLMAVGVTVLLGVLLLIGGFEILISAFWTGRWSGFLIHVLIGIFYVVVGLLIVDRPDLTVEILTLLIAAFLIVGGIFRMVAALTLRFHDWGWVLLNGGISLLLGIMIFERWPSSSLWVIGLFVGIEMILNGWTWIATSLILRRLSQSEETQSA